MENVRILADTPQCHWLLPFSLEDCCTIIAEMLNSTGRPSGDQLELLLICDAEMEELNKTMMQCPGPTNILSFPAQKQSYSQMPPIDLGSLALSVETLHRECFLYSQAPEIHCVRLLAHGLAHLLGHDHGPEMDALCETMTTRAKVFYPQTTDN